MAAANSGSEMVLGGFDKTIWPLARFWVQRVVKGELRDSFAVGLPRGFQYDAYHTIRVIKQGNAFTFFLDGKEIAAARFPIEAAQPGLFTEGVRAAFDDVQMKQLVVSQNLVLNPGFESEQWDGNQPTKENSWTFSGQARVNDCCAHSGLRRLLVAGGAGAAQQEIRGLTSGHYILHAWVLSTSGTTPSLSVGDFGGPEVVVRSAGEQWHRVTVEFTVPEGHASAIVRFAAQVPEGTAQYAVADDFYLFKE